MECLVKSKVNIKRSIDHNRWKKGSYSPKTPKNQYWLELISPFLFNAPSFNALLCLFTVVILTEHGSHHHLVLENHGIRLMTCIVKMDQPRHVPCTKFHGKFRGTCCCCWWHDGIRVTPSSDMWYAQRKVKPQNKLHCVCRHHQCNWISSSFSSSTLLNSRPNQRPWNNMLAKIPCRRDKQKPGRWDCTLNS